MNQAGQWIGKILGAPGSNTAGSQGLTLSADSNGNISASNSGNGSNSLNTSGSSSNNTSNTSQSNNGKIVNNISLSANSGNNASNDNTGGNSTIKTGDAKIIANLINFVNNNISSDGNLVVTVVNVFGTWIGDFVTPGTKKTNQIPQTNVTDGNNADNSQQQENSGSSSQNTQNNPSQPTDNSVAPQSDNNSVISQNSETSSPVSLVLGISRNADIAVSNVAKSIRQPKLILGKNFVKTKDDNEIKINLAWGTLIVPMLFAGIIAGRRFRRMKGAQNV